ncbi:hypothetical protein Dimus_039395 [Dionaea muscipula]
MYTQKEETNCKCNQQEIKPLQILQCSTHERKRGGRGRRSSKIGILPGFVGEGGGGGGIYLRFLILIQSPGAHPFMLYSLLRSKKTIQDCTH